jgi:hypothetical protein
LVEAQNWSTFGLFIFVSHEFSHKLEVDRNGEVTGKESPTPTAHPRLISEHTDPSGTMTALILYLRFKENPDDETAA